MSHAFQDKGSNRGWHEQGEDNREISGYESSGETTTGGAESWSHTAYAQMWPDRSGGVADHGCVHTMSRLDPYPNQAAQRLNAQGYNDPSQGFEPCAESSSASGAYYQPSVDDHEPANQVHETYFSDGYSSQAPMPLETTEPYIPTPTLSIGDDHVFQDDCRPSAQNSYSRSRSGLSMHSPAHGTPQNSAEYSVVCPYHCGTILTGVHAEGNLTRHLKTQACIASRRAKVKYACPIQGCMKEYSRSDGLKVHMRKQHGAPAAIPRNEPFVEGGMEDDDE